ncbi:hypothetical protein KEM56_004436 [Ascosphaera pollenicola]|nr:hypothetical protein KEM56_004436 [Ascosphaera pollenicola]
MDLQLLHVTPDFEGKHHYDGYPYMGFIIPAETWAYQDLLNYKLTPCFFFLRHTNYSFQKPDEAQSKMRLSIWTSLLAVAFTQARDVYPQHLVGKFLEPSSNTKDLKYHAGEEVHVTYELEDGFTTANYGFVTFSNGSASFDTYYPQHNITTNPVKVSLKIKPDPPNSHLQHKFYVNVSNHEGVYGHFKSVPFKLREKDHNGTKTTTTTSLSTSGLFTGTAVTSTKVVSASKTYNSATLTASASSTTADSGSMSIPQDLPGSALTLSSLICALLGARGISGM